MKSISKDGTKRNGATLALSMMAMLAVSACGGSGSGSSPGSDGAKQQGTNNCSSGYVTDFNLVNLKLRGLNGPSTLQEFKNAKSFVNQFGAKYKGVVCDAVLQNDNQLDGVLTTINTDQKVGEWNQALDEAIKQFP